MNERIKQLWEDSDTIQVRYPEQGSPVSVSEQTLEKFAELIVRECTDLLFDEAERLYGYSTECNNMRESEEAELVSEKCVDLITMIEKHFGVTE